MEKTILQYQKAFNSIIERLKNNDSVLAAMVFGSIVTGDLWDESDIDLFVILDNKLLGINNIYTSEKEIPIHIKIMSKNKFIQFCEDDLRGGFIYRIFASSRLVFSKDQDITNCYDRGRYYPDIDRKRWNMVYLGNVLKNVGICRKYLYNDGIYTAYVSAVKCVEDFAKLYVNSSGHMISKDAMTMAINVDEEFKKHVDSLFFTTGDSKSSIEDCIDYILENIDKNLGQNTEVLINYMRQKDCFLSAEDIKKDNLFKDFDIDMEEILNKLWEKNLIKKETRDYKIDEGKVLFKENVYFI